MKSEKKMSYLFDMYDRAVGHYCVVPFNVCLTFVITCIC